MKMEPSERTSSGARVGPAEPESLLSPEESARRARPLRCWNVAERGRVALAASEVLRRWSIRLGAAGVDGTGGDEGRRERPCDRSG